MRQFFSALSVICILMLGGSAFAANNDSFNFRFSPLSLFAAEASVNLDIAISPSWTVGPILQYQKVDLSSNSSNLSSSFKIDRYTVGLRTNWFKNGAFTDGLYLGPSVKYENYNVHTADSTGQTLNGSVGGYAVGCLIGYGWFWNSFNMMLGIGADVGLGNNQYVTVTDSQGNVSQTHTALTSYDGEFTLGWTF